MPAGRIIQPMMHKRQHRTEHEKLDKVRIQPEEPIVDLQVDRLRREQPHQRREGSARVIGIEQRAQQREVAIRSRSFFAGRHRLFITIGRAAIALFSRKSGSLQRYTMRTALP